MWNVAMDRELPVERTRMAEDCKRGCNESSKEPAESWDENARKWIAGRSRGGCNAMNLLLQP